MSENLYYDATGDDFRRELVGKSIKRIVGNTIELSDGTVLETEDTSSCCAWFDATIEAIDLTDNAITSVEEVNTSQKDDYDERFSIHILSAHKLIAKVNIEGNATSGYYCHSINLRVKRPKINPPATN